MHHRNGCRSRTGLQLHVQALALYGAILSVSIRRAFAFRANLIAETLVSVLNVIASLAIVRSVFWVSGSVHGWTGGDAIVLLGFYLMGSGLIGACVEPNLRWFRDRILLGDLDEVLLRPVSSMALASLGTCAPFVLSQAVAGVGVVLLGLTRLPAPPSAGGSVLALVLFGAGCLTIWAVRLVLASLAFWAPSAQPDVGFRALWEFGRYPVSIYARPIQMVLTVLVPVALVATVPAQAITGRIGPTAIATTVTVCAASVLTARWVWRAGLRRYTSATS